VIEIESLAEFDARLRKTQRLNGWFVQSVDLTERTDALLNVDPRGAVFLGCLFAPTVEHHLRRSGALLFPRLPDLPFDPYRTRPYDAAELYGSHDYLPERGCGRLRLVTFPRRPIPHRQPGCHDATAPLTDVYPAWPLLRRLVAGRPMADSIFCVNDVKEGVDLLVAAV
jgi:hypothetical protein